MIALLIFLVVSAVAVLTLGTTATRTVSKLWFRHWLEYREGSSQELILYLEEPEQLSNAAGTAAMLMVFAVAALLASINGVHSWKFAVNVLVFLALLLLVGHLLPRVVGRRWAEAVAPFMIPVLHVVGVALRPFERAALLVGRPFMRKPSGQNDREAREGLEGLLSDGALVDIDTAEERAMISGVIKFGEKTVGEIMRSRSEIFSVPDGLEPAELARRVAGSGYSRVPVYRERPYDIVGMVHVFDIFKRRGESLPPILPVSRTTPDRAADDLLAELLRTRRQLAIVQETNASGPSLLGLVTLEDLLEELVGDIRDEHDDTGD